MPSPAALSRGPGQHRSAVAALQLANLEVKCGNLLVELSDHLRAGIDLIRGGHGHAALASAAAAAVAMATRRRLASAPLCLPWARPRLAFSMRPR